jgi:hypothetical protein
VLFHGVFLWSVPVASAAILVMAARSAGAVIGGDAGVEGGGGGASGYWLRLRIDIA